MENTNNQNKTTMQQTWQGGVHASHHEHLWINPTPSNDNPQPANEAVESSTSMVKVYSDTHGKRYY